MPDKSDKYAAMRRYRAKQAEAGLVQAVEWIPGDKRDQLRDVARALREESTDTAKRRTDDESER